MSEALSERKPPRVDIIVVDPRQRFRAQLMRAAARGVFASLVFTFIASAAARALLPWYRTPAIDDTQPCNCRAPVREALERALTEALVVEAVLAALAFVVVTALVFWFSRKGATEKSAHGR
jgi:Zn-dependent protease with chaperone function